MTFTPRVCIIISSIPSNTIDYVRINEKKKTMRFNTSLLHAGVTKETNGSTLPPVYQTSAFEQDSAADLEKIFETKLRATVTQELPILRLQLLRTELQSSREE